MAQIQPSQVTEQRGYTRYDGGDRSRGFVSKRLNITGVSAGDTATAAVALLSQLTEAHGASSAGTPVLVGIDTVANVLIIGAGPANAAIQVTVVGSPTIPKGY